MIPSRWSSAIAILRRRRQLEATEEERVLRRRSDEASGVDAIDEGGTTAGETAPTDSMLQQSALELRRIHSRIRALLKQLTGG